MTKYTRPLGIMLLYALCSLHTACQSKGQAQQTDTLTESTQQRDSLQLIFVGDIMTHGPQIRAALIGAGRYDFTPSFALVKEQIQRADLALANLETTFGGTPYSGYPMFSSPTALGEALRDAGFDVLTTANNHSCDRRGYGITHTIDVLDSLGIATTGSYRTPEERPSRTPLIREVHGVKIAILAYTYGTNGLPIPHPALVDTIRREQIASDLRRADSLGADYKIVQIHWGNEYEKNPSRAQRDLALWLSQQGVDAIIGSHPHVVQESAFIESANKSAQVFVIYSMGNFISNQVRPAATRGGMLLTLTLLRDRATGTWTTKPSYQYVFVEKRTPQGKPIYRLRPVSLDSVPTDLALSEAVDLKAMQRYYKTIPLVR